MPWLTTKRVSLLRHIVAEIDDHSFSAYMTWLALTDQEVECLVQSDDQKHHQDEVSAKSNPLPLDTSFYPRESLRQSVARPAFDFARRFRHQTLFRLRHDRHVLVGTTVGAF